MNFIIESREEWLNNRKKGVGGSDIAAIVGLDPYKSALDVYLDKVGEAEPVQDNDFMKAGRYMEPVVAEMFQDETGLQLITMPSTITGSKPHYLASVDRCVLGQNIPVEIKTSKRYHAEPLDKWKLQAAWYAAIMNAPGYYIAWFTYPTFKYEYFDVDHELSSMLFQAADEFWQCVETRTPPEGNSVFVASQGAAMEASEYLAERIALLSTKKQEAAEIDEEIKQLEEEIKPAIRENEIVTKDGCILLTFKEQKGRDTIDTKAFKAAYPDLAAQFIKQGKPFRVLRIKP